MAVKKRHKTKVMIQQRQRVRWRDKHKKTLISAGSLAGVFLCGSMYIGAHLWVKASEAPVTAEVATLETTDDTKQNAVASMVASKIIIPENKKLKVSSGDTLLGLLTDTGVSIGEAHEAVAAIREIYDPRRINRGQQVALSIDASQEDPSIPSITALTMPISSTATLELKRKENGSFTVKKVEVPVTEHTIYKNLPIKGSFYETAASAGLTPQIIAELIKAYSYDVDFQRDVKRGHNLEVVLDELRTADGKVVSSRNLRFASLNLGKKKIGVYRYTDKNGFTAYYNSDGESLRKALLRTPINGARISSGFGMRKHPIQGYTKMHRGVDFAAPTGTPIYAAGDGVIGFAGRKGGYGNFVQIKHNGKYATGYGHASRIAKGIKTGVRVKQGQVIAYVGSTGNSTGPHLHYEVMVGGSQVNPSGVKFKTGNALAGIELRVFRRQVESVQAMVSGKATKKVASAEPSKPKKKTAKN